MSGERTLSSIEPVEPVEPVESTEPTETTTKKAKKANTDDLLASPGLSLGLAGMQLQTPEPQTTALPTAAVAPIPVAEPRLPQPPRPNVGAKILLIGVTFDSAALIPSLLKSRPSILACAAPTAGYMNPNYGLPSTDPLPSETPAGPRTPTGQTSTVIAPPSIKAERKQKVADKKRARDAAAAKKDEAPSPGQG